MKFAIGEKVRINVSAEQGKIIGAAQYEVSENQYLIRYCAGDGRAVENWWNESALTAPTSNV